MKRQEIMNEDKVIDRGRFLRLEDKLSFRWVTDKSNQTKKVPNYENIANVTAIISDDELCYCCGAEVPTSEKQKHARDRKLFEFAVAKYASLHNLDFIIDEVISTLDEIGTTEASDHCANFMNHVDNIIDGYV